MANILILLVQSGIIISLSLLILRWVSQKKRVPDHIFGIIAISYLFRILIAVIVDYAGTIFGQVDFYRFDQALWHTAQAFRNGVFTEPFAVAARENALFYIPYTIVYSPVYVVFGHKTLLARFMFALLGTLFVFNTYRLGEAIHGQTTGTYAAVFSAIFPYWVYLSTIFYRDMLIMLVWSQLLLIVIRLRDRRHLLSVSTAVLLAGLLVVLRPENIFPAAILVSLAFYCYLGGWQSWLRKAAGGGILATGILSGHVFNLVSLSGVVGRLNSLVETVSSGSGVYLETVTYFNLASVVAFAPIGATYFLLVPFPWQIHNALALIAFAQNVVLWYPTVILAVIGVPYLFSRQPVAAIILFAFLISGVAPYGLVERNMGPALRHRSQFQIVFVLFASIALTERTRWVLEKNGIRNSLK